MVLRMPIEKTDPRELSPENRYVYLNDRLVTKKNAVVSVYDHGFLYGDGIYETMRVYNGVVFMFDEHLERLSRSADLISLDLPKKNEDIKTAVYRTLKANSHPDASVRISVTRGYGEIGLNPDLCEKPTFIIMAHQFKEYPKHCREEGVKVMIAETRRNYRKALNPQIKSHNFLNNILARIEAKSGDYFEAIMLNHEGLLAEGTVSNIFFIKHGELCTPSVDIGILDGITRSIIIELAAETGIGVKEGRFSSNDIKTADEVFISNSLMEIMPVTVIGDKKVADGDVGRLTRDLLKTYRENTRAYVARKRKNQQ